MKVCAIRCRSTGVLHIARKRGDDGRRAQTICNRLYEGDKGAQVLPTEAALLVPKARPCKWCAFEISRESLLEFLLVFRGVAKPRQRRQKAAKAARGDETDGAG